MSSRLSKFLHLTNGWARAYDFRYVRIAQAARNTPTAVAGAAIGAAGPDAAAAAFFLETL